MLATIQKQQQDATQLAKRFKLLQKTLVRQQDLLNRYQQALMHSSKPIVSVEHDGHRNRQRVCEDSASGKLQMPKREPNEQQAVAAAAEEGKEGKEDDEQQHDPNNWTHVRSKKRTFCDDEGGDALKDANGSTRGECLLPQTHRSPTKTVTATTSTTTTASPNSQDHASTRMPPKLTERKLMPRKTWKEEKEAMQQAKRRQQQQQQTPPRPPLQLLRKQEEANKENQFPYVEVVRKKDERARLPAHDCYECRRYYDALGGVLPDANDAAKQQKHTCSRHRARFEPYNTPDDFWRLSFPDSEAPDSSPLE